jgi:hypothetical protein
MTAALTSKSVATEALGTEATATGSLTTGATSADSRTSGVAAVGRSTVPLISTPAPVRTVEQPAQLRAGQQQQQQQEGLRARAAARDELKRQLARYEAEQCGAGQAGDVLGPGLSGQSLARGPLSLPDWFREAERDHEIASAGTPLAPQPPTALLANSQSSHSADIGSSALYSAAADAVAPTAADATSTAPREDVAVVHGAAEPPVVLAQLAPRDPAVPAVPAGVVAAVPARSEEPGRAATAAATHVKTGSSSSPPNPFATFKQAGKASGDTHGPHANGEDALRHVLRHATRRAPLTQAATANPSPRPSSNQVRELWWYVHTHSLLAIGHCP